MYNTRMSRITIVTAFLCGLTAILPNPALAAGSAFQITTVSTRPDKITGGDVLVRINVPEDRYGRANVGEA